MAIKTVPFDPAEHLRSTEDQVELLNDAFATGDVAYIANAVGTIARAHGMSEVARGAGVTREALYKVAHQKWRSKAHDVCERSPDPQARPQGIAVDRHGPPYEDHSRPQ